MKNKKTTIPLKDFMVYVTDEEREFVEQEKKDYKKRVDLREKTTFFNTGKISNNNKL